jgi:hypothetical protein
VKKVWCYVPVFYIGAITFKNRRSSKLVPGKVRIKLKINLAIFSSVRPQTSNLIRVQNKIWETKHPYGGGQENLLGLHSKSHKFLEFAWRDYEEQRKSSVGTVVV